MTNKNEREHPTEITLCLLEVAVMPNGEVICAGRTLGWVNGAKGLGKYLTTRDEWRRREITRTTPMRLHDGGSTGE